MQVALKKFFTDIEIADIFADASGATNYWGTVFKNSNERIKLWERTDEEKHPQFNVYAEDIQHAALAIICNRLAGDMVLNDLANRSLDWIVVDALVQVACFGEVRYG